MAGVLHGCARTTPLVVEFRRRTLLPLDDLLGNLRERPGRCFGLISFLTVYRK